MSVCIIVIVVERNHNKGYLKQLNLNIYFLLFKQSGELSEWLKEHAWKACVRCESRLKDNFLCLKVDEASNGKGFWNFVIFRAFCLFIYCSEFCLFWVDFVL